MKSKGRLIEMKMIPISTLFFDWLDLNCLWQISHAYRGKIHFYVKFWWNFSRKRGFTIIYIFSKWACGCNSVRLTGIFLCGHNWTSQLTIESSRPMVSEASQHRYSGLSRHYKIYNFSYGCVSAILEGKADIFSFRHIMPW